MDLARSQGPAPLTSFLQRGGVSAGRAELARAGGPLPGVRNLLCWRHLERLRHHGGTVDSPVRPQDRQSRGGAVQRVLVVCGAGASSTFLVHWMRKAAEARGLDLTIEAGSSAQVPSELDGVTAVLVGAHLAEQFAALQA